MNVFPTITYWFLPAGIVLLVLNLLLSFGAVYFRQGRTTLELKPQKRVAWMVPVTAQIGKAAWPDRCGPVDDGLRTAQHRKEWGKTRYLGLLLHSA